MYAFRCRHCGHLHEAEHAGESSHPHACRVCGHGIAAAIGMDDTLRHPHAQAHAKALAGIPRETLEKHPSKGGRTFNLPHGLKKVLIFENWEVLADATDERLAELGLTRAEVCRHEPKTSEPGRDPQVVTVSATDGVHTTDSASAG
jgi:rubredoxin